MKAVVVLIEELVLNGLSGASQATLERLEQAFQETARAGHLRLGLCLRAAGEEMAAFLKAEDEFSARRLYASLVRAWWLARRPVPAAAAPQLYGQLEVVAVGVSPRLVSGGLVAFDWRLRRLDDGRALLWSCLVPHRWPGDVPLEVMLAVPQKQGFAPASLLERRRLHFQNCTVAAGRLSLGPDSKLRLGEPFQAWSELIGWDKAGWRSQLQAYRPGPSDSELELQAEICLTRYQLHEDRVEADGVSFSLVIPRGPSGQRLRSLYPHLQACDPLLGLIHFHRGRLHLQPISQWTERGPRFLTVDESQVDRKLALKAFSFGKEKR